MLTSYKLIFAIGIVGMISISIFSYLSAKSYRKQIITGIENHANQLSETVKRSTRYDMLQNNRPRIRRIIDTIGQQGGIERVRVINKVGTIIYSSLEGEVNSIVDMKGEMCYGCHGQGLVLDKLTISQRTRFFKTVDGHKYLGIISPVYNERACWESSCHVHGPDSKVLGVMDVIMSLETVDTQINTFTAELMILAFIAIAANGFVLWFLVYKLFGKPTKELLAATDAVSAGDYKYKVNIGEKHEMRKLALSFNAMIDKISETQNQLYHNAKLASLGQIAAGIAHEINNPLTGVLTYSSYHLKRIEGDKLDKKELKESLNVIVRETKRCREIIKGLLDFARQVPPKKTKNNINVVIEQALAILENELVMKNISVDKFFLDDIPDIEADFVQLQQVFINLITNAAHAIGEKGGGIVILTHLKDVNSSKFIEVKISDTGHGIPRDKINSIFDPFFSTKGQEGTGLGLSVVLGIIDEHNGKIDVESEVEKGTTFTIKLPL